MYLLDSQCFRSAYAMLMQDTTALVQQTQRDSCAIMMRKQNCEAATTVLQMLEKAQRQRCNTRVSIAKAQRKHSDQFVATLTFEHSKRIFWPPRQCCINVHKRCDICNRVAYTERLYCKSIAIWCDVLENSVAMLSLARCDWGITKS